MDIAIIGKCQEPWIYWWELQSQEDRIRLKTKHFPHLVPAPHVALRGHEVYQIWEYEEIHPLQDYDWIELADLTFRDIERFNKNQSREIWRQVYRIASERI